VSGIKAFNRIDAGACILDQVKDIHLAMAQNDSHANRRMTKAVDAAIYPSLQRL
jgi:hypothetical protein